MLSEFHFSKNIIGFIVEDTLDTPVVEQMHQHMLEAFKANNSINVFIEFQGIAHFSKIAAMDGMGFLLRNSERFKKIAIITNHRWLRRMGGIQNIILPIAIEVFPSERRVEAMSWVMESEPNSLNSKAIPPSGDS